MTELEKLSEGDNLKNVELSSVEYDYIKSYLKELYKAFGVVPVKMRTEKYYILENLVKETFK